MGCQVRKLSCLQDNKNEFYGYNLATGSRISPKF
jgi:hypothetical protein